jgi:hypothetical protein
LPFAGWSHVQGGREVVALAVEQAATLNGTVRFSQSANGEGSVRLTPAAPAASHALTAYLHFVSTPVQIGAATAPPAILAPLSVTVVR